VLCPGYLPLLDVSLEAAPEECVKEITAGLVVWCTVMGVKPATRVATASSWLQAAEKCLQRYCTSLLALSSSTQLVLRYRYLQCHSR